MIRDDEVFFFFFFSSCLYLMLSSIVHYAVCMQDELDLPEVGDFLFFR